MSLRNVPIYLGVALMALGLVAVLAIYGKLPGLLGPSLILSPDDHEKVPWELFKYALFGVALGPVFLIYKTLLENAHALQQEQADNHAEATRFRDDMIAVMTDLKNARRLLRHHAHFHKPPDAACVTIDATDFAALYPVFLRGLGDLETLQWKLDAPIDFLGNQQAEVVEQITTLEEFLNNIVHEADFKLRRSEAGELRYATKTYTYQFLQASNADTQVQKLFFDPIRKARKALKNRLV